MKPKRLSIERLNNIDKNSILYAEFSEPGAMGACGTSRIFFLDDGILQFYLVSVHDGKTQKQKDAINEIYVSTYNFLKNLTKEKILVEKYAGFGNHTWKRRDVTFKRDDDHFTFVYQKSKQNYLIPTSNPGVYHSIVAEFAEREVSIKDLAKYFNSQKDSLSLPEQDFFEAYLNQLDENDNRLGIFQFTVKEYWDAIRLLKYRNLEEFNLPAETIREGEKAIARYKLKYVLDTLGWNQLDEFFAKYVKEKMPSLFKPLNAKLSYHIEDVYKDIKIKKASSFKIDISIGDSLEKYLNKPELVYFSEEAKTKIIKDILASSTSNIRTNARSIEFFLANFCYLEDISYSKMLPVASRIIKIIPFDDFNHTKTNQLFWLVGEIIDRAWRFADINEKTQKHIRDFIFDAYGSRVGSLWPIINYEEFTFKDPAGQEMFDDSISYIMSLIDITDRIPGLEPYLRVVAEQNYHANASVLNRARSLVRDKLPTKKTLKYILEHEDPKLFGSLLSHPDSIVETDELMDKLLAGDERFDNYSRISILELLLLNNSYPDSRIVVNEFINEHFDEIASSFGVDAKAVGIAPDDFLFSIFTAACVGVYEPEELAGLESLADKYQARGFDTHTIVAALRYANLRIDKIAEIKDDLAKFFA
ncbi:hypothetical protein IK146_01220 [Candidatus Saccharibacteria bacterium]|nr:hypothetical protein [Candidatus Saccharibacteria bacterium]